LRPPWGLEDVERIFGNDRYQTADAVALRTIEVLGPSYDGTAFVATGGNFPDALAAAPLAAAQGWPLFLAHPTGGLLPGTVAAMGAVEEALILGGTGAVSSAVEAALASPALYFLHEHRSSHPRARRSRATYAAGRRLTQAQHAGSAVPPAARARSIQ
jgi:putative cell wall-binding protein